MKTCATIAPADPGRSSPRPEEASAAVWLGPVSARVADVDFACPACASPLRVPRSMAVVVGACPACGSRVVAPQPECGWHAMPYRDWLRLQETDSPESPASTGVHELAPPRPPTAPRLTVPAPRPRRFPPIPMAAGLTLAGAVLVGAVLLGAGIWALTGGAPPAPTLAVDAPGTRMPSSAQAETPAVPAAEPAPAPTMVRPPVASARATIEPPGPPAPTPLPPLATVLDRQTPEGTVVVVRATRAHTFSRSAPAEDMFLCLKLTDETDPSVSTRAYLPLPLQATASARAALPWGHDLRVAVSLRWQEGDPATGVAGHWQVVTFEDAAPSLSSAR